MLLIENLDNLKKEMVTGSSSQIEMKYKEQLWKHQNSLDTMLEAK